MMWCVSGLMTNPLLVNAIKKAFPQSTHYLCTQHLKDNVNSYLADKVGASERGRIKIVSEIFGESSLAQAKLTS